MRMQKLASRKKDKRRLTEQIKAKKGQKIIREIFLCSQRRDKLINTNISQKIKYEKEWTCF